VRGLVCHARAHCPSSSVIRRRPVFGGGGGQNANEALPPLPFLLVLCGCSWYFGPYGVLVAAMARNVCIFAHERVRNLSGSVCRFSYYWPWPSLPPVPAAAQKEERKGKRSLFGCVGVWG
jgi:hypothetical protein